jgi:hypothetical protein
VAATILAGATACGSKDSGGHHDVFFVGYVYDGATGARLDKTVLSNVSMTYGDKDIKLDIEDDGRFVTRDPLPTWQDYVVTIEANGYRSFVSYNQGVDLPASLAMTNGIAQASTQQTLDYAAYLFPTALKSPAMTLTVTAPDPVTGLPTANAINGTLRLRPLGLPAIEIDTSGAAALSINRVWANDNDLLTQTVVKSIMNGSVSVDEGELVYGVAYEVAIYDVPGYQPLVASTVSGLPGSGALVAGTVTSRSFTLVRDAQDPLKIIGSDALSCLPPPGSSTSYGAKITLTFSADIEIVGTTYAEDVDNGLSITEPTPPSSTTTVIYYCPLKTATGDPSQERGSKVEVAGPSLSFSFNPSIGLATTYFGTTCMVPPSITSVSYGGISAMMLQPMGDPSRRRLLTDMLFERGSTSGTITCPSRTGL